MHVRQVRCGRFTRVDGHDLHCWSRIFRGQNALMQYRVAPSQVGSHQDNQICRFQILISAGNSICAKSAFVPCDRRRHAKSRVRVDIRCADKAFHELVGNVIVLGQQLTRDVESHAVRSVSANAVCKGLRGRANRVFPTGTPASDLGVQQAPLEIYRFSQSRPFGA